MIQAKQQAAPAFAVKGPQKSATKTAPEIVWEVPPPDFDIPDDPLDDYDQFLLAVALQDALSSAGYLSDEHFFATSLSVCAKVNGRTTLKAPDWFFVPYVYQTQKNYRSYTPEAEGKPLAIVIEFVSDSEGREYDNSSSYPYGKWYFYETILKVPWYVIFDSEIGELEVYHLEKGHYKKQAADENGWYWIDSMALLLGIWKGLKKDVYRNIYWLRWWDADANLLPWEYEKAEKAEIEHRKALAEIKNGKTLAEIKNCKALAEIKKRKALNAKIENRNALEKVEIEKRNALEKLEIEKHKALEKVEIEKLEVMEKAKQTARNSTVQTARSLLQARVEISIIQQVTGLEEEELLLLNSAK